MSDGRPRGGLRRAAVTFSVIAAFLLFLCPSPIVMVKKEDFKRCDQSAFCVRQRAFAKLADKTSSHQSTYVLDPATASYNEDKGSFSGIVTDESTSTLFQVELQVLKANTVRLRMFQKDPIRKPFEIPPGMALVESAAAMYSPLSNYSVSDNKISFQSDEGQTTVAVQLRPFQVDVFGKGSLSSGVPDVSFNEKGYLNYERQRKKEDEPAEPEEPPAVEGAPEPTEEEKEIKQLQKDLKKDKWEESFNGKQDSKPHGPTSIGFDLNFHGAEHLYGLPEHATSYSLKPTRGNDKAYTEPYRLYNFDVFEYELNSAMALYGSIPFVMAHKEGRSTAALFLNAAEIWVDVEKHSLSAGSRIKVSEGAEPIVQGGSTTSSTHWMAESGILDMVFFLGSQPSEISKSLIELTGRPAMPQLFAIGYHQCRWNYLDEQDVADVDANFDQYDIPYDVLWLDIEHTDGKKYFTWDKVKFPNPKAMIENLSVKGRKMVTIIDPHIKRDDSFPVSKQAKDLGLFVKSASNEDFEGWCWPGSSNWIDYLNPAGRKYWAEQFLLNKYEGSTPTLYTWNDMNEPSVFNGPEITMPKDNLHFGGWEHRDVHNLYGALQQRATYEGHLLRSSNNDRPFVLSRAFFIGTQRYGAIWTGDNFAQWDHLEASIPMLLTIGLSGVTFSGADVGGFFGNPEADLLVRWYQAGAFQPFFRGHAHIDTKRREPWLFGEPYTTLIRDAIRRRYKLLPYIYTTFWQSHAEGKPVMRALMYEFPADRKTFAIENAFMLGSSLLVHPVTAKDIASVDVYLPTAASWYDYETFKKVPSGTVSVETPLDKVPVFLRGGSIVARRDRVRRAGTLGVRDPFTLLVALDANGKASGDLYVDDGHSFDYEKGVFISTTFSFENGILRATVENKVTDVTLAAVGSRVERIILLGYKKAVKSIGVQGGSRLEYQSESVDGGDVVLTVKDPKVQVGQSWIIEIK
ncbi:hypothetical protein HDV05_003925 [Chytridiales sp. JEL 0842]|nr:hypothetical protein HDV05_003925 [Chytridiales sp. JEL 0842]